MVNKWRKNYFTKSMLKTLDNYQNLFKISKKKKLRNLILETYFFSIYTIVINTEQQMGVRFFNLINL